MGISDFFTSAIDKTSATTKKNVGSGTSKTYFPAARVAGSAVKADVVETITDYGFILFFIGLAVWLLNIYLNPAAKIIMGTILMCYSSLLIFQRKGILLIILFWTWYIYFGARTDQTFALYFGIISLSTLFIYYKLINKERNVGDELKAGAIPIIIFFLDIGLISLLTTKFNLPLTDLTQSLILFIPWWALLGLFTSQKQSNLLSFFKAVGILYVIVILVIGLIPSVGYTEIKSTLPGAEQFLAAQEKVQSQISGKENPFVSNLACITEFENFQGCVNKRQEDSELNNICKKQEKKQEGTEDFAKCVNDQREKKKKEAASVLVGGTNDPTISQPTKAEFIETKFSTKNAFTEPGKPILQQIEFKINNPRKQIIDLEFSCSFVQGDKNIEAKILGNSLEKSVGGETIRRTIVCQGPNTFKGTFNIVYEAKIKGLKSVSRLQRAFIPEIKDYSQNEEMKKEILSTYFNSNNQWSQGAEDLSRVDFAFGNPVDNPIVEPTSMIIFSSVLRNPGKGKIIAIKNYKFTMNNAELDSLGFSVKSGDENCLSGTSVTLPPLKTSFIEQIPLSTCIINLPDNFKNLKEYQYREFEGAVEYDYLVRKEISMTVKTLELS
ncbi:ABC transporter permease [Candidatus Woesearchaeota archaeon]|nr:ABC transporter permease [Candidatus Woesearchaeota archaeon]